jgi:hypothetical protein
MFKLTISQLYCGGQLPYHHNHDGLQSNGVCTFGEYTHISTEKDAAFDSKVRFVLFISLNWNKNNVNQIETIFMYWSILLSCVKKSLDLGMTSDIPE